MPLRHQPVVVAVVYNKRKGFFLAFNPRWRGYGFPMKRVRPDTGLRELAKSALEEHLAQPLPGDTEVKPLEVIGSYSFSPAVAEHTYYEHHCFAFDPDLNLPQGSFAAECGFLTYAELAAEANQRIVTWSTRDLAKALVESQEVALAVIAYSGAGGAKFLLVDKPNYGGLFFPVARLTTEAKPEQMVIRAVQSDTGYRGPMQTKWCGEVQHLQFSPRYDRERRFRFHVCRVELPRQPLEAALAARGIAWDWVDEARLRAGTGMSPTVQSVLASVIQAAQ